MHELDRLLLDPDYFETVLPGYAYHLRLLWVDAQLRHVEGQERLTYHLQPVQIDIQQLVVIGQANQKPGILRESHISDLLGLILCIPFQ